MRWGDYLLKAQVEERVCVYFSFVWFVYVAMCSSGPTQYIFHTPMARYNLFVLKVSLNTNKTKQTNCPSLLRTVTAMFSSYFAKRFMRGLHSWLCSNQQHTLFVSVIIRKFKCWQIVHFWQIKTWWWKHSEIISIPATSTPALQLKCGRWVTCWLVICVFVCTVCHVFLHCVDTVGDRAPCGLQGCKNRPAPFPGQMSYKATKPGSVCPVS